MQQTPLCLYLAEQRRPGIWGKNVKRRAFQTVLLDPFGRPGEDVLPVVIESQYERTIHLDAVVVQHADPARIVGSLRRFLPCLREVLIRERFESPESARTSGSRPLAH